MVQSSLSSLTIISSSKEPHVHVPGENRFCYSLTLCPSFFLVGHMAVYPSILINNNRTRTHHDRCKIYSIRCNENAVFFVFNRTYAGWKKKEFSFFSFYIIFISILLSLFLTLTHTTFLFRSLSQLLANSRHSSPSLYSFPSVLLAWLGAIKTDIIAIEFLRLRDVCSVYVRTAKWK